MIARSVESGTAAMEARSPGDEYSTSESVDGELGYEESKPESFEVTFNIAIFSRGDIKQNGTVKTAWTGCRWAEVRGKENVE